MRTPSAPRAPVDPPARSGTGGKIKNPWLFKKIEAAIIALEAEREELNAKLVREDVYTDASAVRDVQSRLAEVERDLEDKNAQWEQWA